MPSLAYMQGMQQGLDRQMQIRRLQMEERQEKEQLRAVAEKTKGLRMEASMMGIPKEIAESLGVGELEAAVRTQKEQQAQRLREEGRQESERDQRAMTAAAQTWETLTPEAKRFFVQRTGAEPTMAQQVWDSIGVGGRARAFGVQHPKTLERADQRDREIAVQIAKDTADMARQAAKLAEEKPAREAEIAQKKALTEQAQAGTVEARARTQKTEQETQEKALALERYRMDMDRFAGKAEYQTVQGKLMYRSPGETAWKPVGLSMDEIIMAGRGLATGEGGGLTDTGKTVEPTSTAEKTYAEGTIIRNGNVRMIRKGGQWIPYQPDSK